jgi:hypothetical protein
LDREDVSDGEEISLFLPGIDNVEFNKAMKAIVD